MDKMPNVINVTKTYLPPLEEYVEYLEQIWAANWVTSHGPLVKELEARLKDYLGVRHLFFVSNGTVALQIAIRALALHGEIITTPFSYVASTSSIVWEGCTPVFVDIDPDTLCLDPDLIEGAITPQTTAILPVHIYGHPCDVDRIQSIADQHGLRVIYDAAHAFGVRHNGHSLPDHGDISALSFQATKLFHTVEGGALVTDDDELAHRIRYMRNFGHKGTEEFCGLGVNGKNSEFHAAMGLCVLARLPDIIAGRKAVCDLYDELLAGSGLSRPKRPVGTSYNYAYYPVIFPSEEVLLSTQARLNEEGIVPRRYFFPPLTALDYVRHADTPVAQDVSARILCLPLHDGLPARDVARISCLIAKAVEPSGGLTSSVTGS